MGWIAQVVVTALGVVFVGLGLVSLIGVRRSLSRESHLRRMRLPASLMGAAWLGAGVCLVIVGLTLSRVAFACAAVFLLSEIPIRWLSQRRASQVDLADPT